MWRGCMDEISIICFEVPQGLDTPQSLFNEERLLLYIGKMYRRPPCFNNKDPWGQAARGSCHLRKSATIQAL